MCTHLYEAKDDDNKVTVQEATTGYASTKPKITGFLKLFTGLGWNGNSEAIDHCQDCTERAVLAFMRKFKLELRRGTSIQCRIRTSRRGVTFEEGPALSKNDNMIAREKNRDFFAGFNGKRVRIIVEVL